MYKNINVNSDTFIGDFCRLASWHIFQTYNPHILYVISHISPLLFTSPSLLAFLNILY